MEQALSALGGAVQGVHPFVIYLAGINALTFILFAIDYAIARYNQDEDTGLMDGRILTLFAVAGGALGMLLALMIFTRNHMNKHNIAWWFSAIVFLIVWVFVVLVWAGVSSSIWNRALRSTRPSSSLSVHTFSPSTSSRSPFSAWTRRGRLTATAGSPRPPCLVSRSREEPLEASPGCASPTIRHPSGISRRGCLPASSSTSRCFFLPTAPGLFRGTLNGNFGQHPDDPISRFCFSRHHTVRMR